MDNLDFSYLWEDGIEKVTSFLQKLIILFSTVADKEPLYVAITLVGTVAILFLTITLIPFQQYANQYPSLFKYIRNDRRLLGGFGVFLLLIIFELWLIFLKSTYLTILSAFSGTILSFLVAGYLWRWCIKLLNPKEHIIPKIQRQGIIAVDQLFTDLRKRKKSNEEKIAELGEMMRQTLTTTEKVDGKNERFEIPRTYLKRVTEETRILKELCGGFINMNQAEMFQASWHAIVEITKNYLKRRQKYISNLDYHLLDLSDDVRDIISVAGKTANIHIYRSIWQGIEEIVLVSIDAEIIGSKEGFHGLSAPLINVLKENISKDILSHKVDSAYEATRSIGNIGVQMAVRGHIQSAAYLCNDLTKYVFLSNQVGQIPVQYLSKQYISEIFFQSLNNRVLFANYDYPFRQFIENYDKVLSLQSPQVTIGLTDSISWWDADILKDKSISSLIKVALFPEKDNDDVIFHNLDVVRKLITLMQKHYLKDYTIQTSFTSQLYQIALWLIAFIDKDISLELLVYRETIRIPSEENREKAVKILFDLLDWFFETFLLSYKDKQNRIFERSELLNNLLDLYYILIHLDSVHNLELSLDLNNYINKQLGLTKANLSNIRLSDSEWGSLMLFSEYLAKQELYSKIQKTMSALLRVAGYRYVGEHDLHLLNHIKRPIVTFREDVFTNLDKQRFIREK